MGAEIGNEGIGENCGRGSEGKRRSEEGSVTAIYVKRAYTPISHLTFLDGHRDLVRLV